MLIKKKVGSMKKIVVALFLLFAVSYIAKANEDVVIEIGDLRPRQNSSLEIVLPEENAAKSQEIKANPKNENYSVEYLMNKKDITVLNEGEPFSYPIPNGALIQCYAKKLDGSIDDFTEYNDYFLMKNGELYSNTMHKLYKPEKSTELKLVDRANIIGDGKTLKLYDPLWEGAGRRHKRTIKIDTSTGNYYMTGTQDNVMWYRNITTTGYCRMLKF